MNLIQEEDGFGFSLFEKCVEVVIVFDRVGVDFEDLSSSQSNKGSLPMSTRTDDEDMGESFGLGEAEDEVFGFLITHEHGVPRGEKAMPEGRPSGRDKKLSDGS